MVLQKDPKYATLEEVLVNFFYMLLVVYEEGPIYHNVLTSTISQGLRL